LELNTYKLNNKYNVKKKEEIVVLFQQLSVNVTFFFSLGHKLLKSFHLNIFLQRKERNQVSHWAGVAVG